MDSANVTSDRSHGLEDQDIESIEQEGNDGTVDIDGKSDLKKPARHSTSDTSIEPRETSGDSDEGEFRQVMTIRRTDNHQML